ncbi:MAG TPA: hypothetical protein PKA05_20775, partial [Roseiflexaceae bacterium]|nr:hypothetical protein [Roseiflexaceae bacterium]
AATWLLRSPLTLLVLAALAERRMPGVAVDGLLEVIAIVPQAFNRWYALQNVLFFAMPLLLGLGYGTWRALMGLRRAPPDAAALVRLSMLALAGSWLGWFLFLSVGVPRYLFPPVAIGAIFAGRPCGG